MILRLKNTKNIFFVERKLNKLVCQKLMEIYALSVRIIYACIQLMVSFWQFYIEKIVHIV